MRIDNDKKPSTTAAELRTQAEVRLRAKTVERHTPRTVEATQRLVHELEVYQIELEIQNEELLHERSEREKSEAQLGTHSDLYDFAPVGYFTLDRDEIIRAVNLTGCGLLGIERSQLLGRRIGPFVPVTARPFFSEFLAKVFTSPVKETCELSFLKNAKQPFCVQIEAVAAASGQECRIAVIDSTDRRRAEDALTEKRQELEELNRSLEERIAQNVYELRQKDQMLILKDRQAVMGEMINNIAHQWRQPLNILTLHLQYLPLAYGTEEFNREFLEATVSKSMQLIMHMSQTIDDFMGFFKPDRKKENFRVDGVIIQTLSLIKDFFKAQNIGIAFNSEGEPTILGYPNEFGQVLLNILSNARDALVGRAVKYARISLHAFVAGGKTIVTITDNAGGIDAEIIGRLFDPYFTTKESDKGSGVGLFMSKAIIEKNMGGRLTVRNIEGGVEFRIEI
jgi:signal transduction histidine kinase